MTPMGNVLDVLDVQEFPVLTIMLRQGIEFSLTWWPRWPYPPMAHEYPQWPTLPHHHPQCPTLDTPNDSTPWLHTCEKFHNHPSLIWGHNVSCETSHTTPQYTQPCPHTITITTRGWKGVKPLSHKAHMKKGVHKGPCPWANPGKKKDNKLFFLLHNHLSHKGGFQGGGFPLCRNGNKKHYCFLYLPVSPSVLPASVCFCSLCIWLYVCSFCSTYTIQPHNATYTIQPINE